MSWPPRSVGAALAATLAMLAVATAAGAAAGPERGASAEGPVTIRDYRAVVTVAPDGALQIREEMDYDLGTSIAEDRELSRTFGVRESYDADSDRVYRIDDVIVTVDGVEVDTTRTSDDDTQRYELTLPEGGRQVAWTYEVSGAVASTPDGLEVRWPVVQGFDLPIAGARVEWNAPSVLWLSCLAGAPGSSQPCTTTQLVDVPVPVMTQRDVPAGGQLVGILGLSAEARVAADAELDQRRSLARAFDATGTPLVVALAILAAALLGCLALWWTRGRDRAAGDGADFVVPVAASDDGSWLVTPPAGIRPGQMGTLVDERADVVDISATLVDLATRNYLFIEELPREQFGRADWLLRRRNDAGDELLDYERRVYDAVFGSADEVRVSDLPGGLGGRLGAVQDAMYADLLAQGWFAERPDAVRTRWSTAGWVLVTAGAVLTVVLAWVSTFGLAGLAVLLGGAALVATAQSAPARTVEGARMLGRLRVFRDWLAEAGLPDDVPADQREVVLSRLLPYALVFGYDARWAQALADLDTDADPDEPLHWYGAPDDWHLSDAGASIAQLVTTVNAAVGSRRLLAD